mmetsp:Transcript_14940/g.36572  ORF Transcript_14940/g.36572 Transcript_14940/m.36572 type:complete len:88 (-) Transcript_14940:137-400(-)
MQVTSLDKPVLYRSINAKTLSDYLINAEHIVSRYLEGINHEVAILVKWKRRIRRHMGLTQVVVTEHQIKQEFELWQSHCPLLYDLIV